MKRLIMLLLITTVTFTTVFATGQGEESQSEDSKESLRVMWWGSQTRHERTIEVLDLYAEQNDVEVIYEFAGWKDYWTKLTTMAAGKNLPDIMQIDYNLLMEWQARGLMQSMEPFMDNGTLDFSEIPKSALQGGVINGVQYCAPLGINSNAIAIDVDQFEKAGMEIPKDDWTWDEFEETANELHEKLGIWGFGVQLGNSHVFKSIVLSEGKPPFDYENGGLGYEETNYLTDHFDRVLRLQKAGVIPHISVEASDYEHGHNVENRPVIDGKAAMTYFWSNQLNGFWNAAGGDDARNFKLIMLPRLGNKSANYVKPAMFFAITRDSKNPELAADFINYFINSVEANEILMADRGVPVNTRVQEALIPNLNRAGKESFDFMKRVAENSVPIPLQEPQGWRDLEANVWMPVIRDGIRFGEYTPAEAEAMFRKEAAELIKPVK